MKSGRFHGQLDRDKVTRASLIVRLFKGLRLLFNGPDRGAWYASWGEGSETTPGLGRAAINPLRETTLEDLLGRRLPQERVRAVTA